MERKRENGGWDRNKGDSNHGSTFFQDDPSLTTEYKRKNSGSG